MNPAFITTSSITLGDTHNGLTNPEIKKYFSKFLVKYNIYNEINVSSATKKVQVESHLNLFEPEQQFTIIKELCELEKFQENLEIRNLKIKLFKNYSEYNTESPELEPEIIEEMNHFLLNYPESLKSFNEAVEKLNAKIFDRNSLDDLRFSLEQLLKSILENNKPFEKQNENIGRYLKENKYSSEFQKMFYSLMTHYATYQNENVKHNNRIKSEVEFIFDLTISFMKFLIKVKN